MKSLDANNLIEISNVSKEFVSGESTIQVLKDVSFSVAEGSFTIIHGPSGSGKTTLLNTLAGLEEPTTGTVLYKGKTIYGLTPSEMAHFRARTMGIVYQTNYFVKSLSVVENVALPLYFLGYDRPKAEIEAIKSLKRVGMERHANKLPSVLSGGEQQRVSMARALVSNPTYIVADEPTGNLDSKNGNAIMDLLKYFNEDLKRTIILITHNMTYLSRGTQIIKVSDGEVSVERAEDDKTKNKPASLQKARTPSTTAGSFSIKNTFAPVRLKLLLHMAFRNMLFKRLRSMLTILGVVIGVGSIFILLSFGLGLQNLVQNEIIGADSVKIIDTSSLNAEIIKIDDTSLDRIQNLAHVERIGKLNTTAGEIKFEGANSDAVVYGVDEDYLDLAGLTIIDGRQLDVNSSNEVLINKSLLDSLDISDTSRALGKPVVVSLKLEDGDRPIAEPFTVVGVIESGNGSVLYIPGNVYQSAGEKVFQQVKVVVSDVDNIDGVRRQLEGLGLKTSSPLDTIDQVNRFFRFFNVILVGFGGIGMLIAVLGMFNTLTISLLERTKEIGLMVALGGRRKDMKRLFTTESMLLSLIGGVVGVLGAIVLGIFVNTVLNQVASSRGVADSFSVFSYPLVLIIAVIMFILGVGFLVSYAPAKRAAKINPIDALHNE